jgi:hypothetical protein
MEARLMMNAVALTRRNFIFRALIVECLAARDTAWRGREG